MRRPRGQGENVENVESEQLEADKGVDPVELQLGSQQFHLASRVCSICIHLPNGHGSMAIRLVQTAQHIALRALPANLAMCSTAASRGGSHSGLQRTQQLSAGQQPDQS